MAFDLNDLADESCVPGLISLVFGRFVQAVFFPSFYGFKRGPIGDEDPLALLLCVGISQEALVSCARSIVAGP